MKGVVGRVVLAAVSIDESTCQHQYGIHVTCRFIEEYKKLGSKCVPWKQVSRDAKELGPKGLKCISVNRLTDVMMIDDAKLVTFRKVSGIEKSSSSC